MKTRKIWLSLLCATAMLGLSGVVLSGCDDKKNPEPEVPEVQKFKVTIDLNDGSATTVKEVEQGQKLTGVEEPTREGYTFAGWKVNGAAWTMDETITADITIVAQWTKNETPVENVTVTIHYCDEKTADSNLSVEKGSLITTTKLPNPTREGYKFLGWYQDAAYDNDWNMAEDTVQQDINLYAKWEKLVLISQAAVDSLKSSIYNDGTYVYKSETYGEETIGIVSIFEPTAVKVYEYDLETREVMDPLEFVEYNGNCAAVSHSVQNVVSFTDLQVPFDDFDNPFTGLTIADFAYVSDNVFSIVDDGNGNLNAIACCVTGWEENIKSILVTVKEDKIVGITIETNEMTSEDDTYTAIYTFEIKEHGTAKTGIIVDPYERVPEHDALEAALKKMNHNHTIHCLDVAPGYDDVTYDILVNETVTYDTYDNEGTTYGYIELDGYVYSFAYSEGKVTVGDPLYQGSIELTSSNFTAFKPEVMEYIGNNTFRSYNTELAQEILSYIGPDYDRQRLGSYASYVELEIKDGYVYRVTFDYSAYGAIGTLTLTYDSFDTTTIDIDFTNIEHTSVLDPYKGTWTTTEAGGHTIVVNDSGIFVDEAEFVVTEYDQDYGCFIGTLNGETYYLQLMTERELALYNDANTVYWIFKNTALVQELVTVPEELKGVWAEEGGNMKITIQTHAVFIDGNSVELEYYSENDKILTINYNNGSYYLLINTDQETGVTNLYLSKNDFTDIHIFSLTAESIGVEIPTSYIGIWTNEDESIRIIVRYSGITINKEKYVIASYDKNSGFVGTLGNVTNYMIAPYFTPDKLQVGTTENNAIVTQISNNPKDEDTRIYKQHIGYYEGSTEDGSSTYRLSITESGITINDEKFEITKSTETSYEGLWNGEEWALIYTENQMGLMNSTGSIYINCTLTEAPLPSVTIQSAHVGTYEGTKDNVTYTIVVTAEEITINGTAYTLTAYDDYEGYTGTWEGAEWYLSFYDPNMMLMKSDYSIYVTCAPQGGTVTTPEVQAAHVGTYVGTNADVTYTIVVTTEGITINDTAYTLTAYSDYEGYTGIWNDAEWYLQADNSNMRLMNADFSIVVSCAPQGGETTTPEIQAAHVGTYVGTKDNVTYTVVVTAEAITINDMAVTLLSYVAEGYEEYYTVEWDQANWKMSYAGAWGSYPAAFVLSNGSTEITCDMQGGETTTPEVQASHIGTYVGTKDNVTYTIVVTTEGITINDTSYTLTAYSDYEGYTGTWEGAEWYLQADNSNMRLMNADFSIVVSCAPQGGTVTTPEVQAAHVGTYVGTKDNVTYTIVVTTEGITINDTAYTLTAYSDYEGYTGIWNDEEWYLQADNSNMRLMNADFSIVVSCAPQGGETTTPEIQAAHVGTYVGTKDNVTYTVVVTAESITINDTAVTLLSYVAEGYEEYYTVEWDQANWKMSYAGAWGSYPAAFVLSNGSTEITCDMQGGETTTPEVQASHIGTYVGTKDSVTYTIVITTEGITINDTSYTLTAYSDYEGYTGTWNDAEWCLGYYEATDTAPAYMMLMNMTDHIYVQCDLA